jgi:hypothetical protein
MSKSIPTKNKQSVKTKNSKTYTTKKSRRAPISSSISISGVLEPLRVKHSTSLVTTEKGFEILPLDEKSDVKEREQSFIVALKLLKGIMFKADQPYRTRLPLQGGFVTSASGTLNLTQSAASLSSCSEWSAIDALFDEVFIHSMKFRFFPINNLGGGVGLSNSAGITGGITAIASTTIVNAPIQMVCLFNGSATYSTAAAMAANATLAVHSSSKPFTYTWRNNVRFDRRGLCVNATGFQGWTLIPNISSYGGQIQFRTMQDSILGTGSALVIPGSYLCQYDVSFRARS